MVEGAARGWRPLVMISLLVALISLLGVVQKLGSTAFPQILLSRLDTLRLKVVTEVMRGQREATAPAGALKVIHKEGLTRNRLKITLRITPNTTRTSTRSSKL